MMHTWGLPVSAPATGTVDMGLSAPAPMTADHPVRLQQALQIYLFSGH